MYSQTHFDIDIDIKMKIEKNVDESKKNLFAKFPRHRHRHKYKKDVDVQKNSLFAEFLRHRHRQTANFFEISNLEIDKFWL